MPFPIVFYLHSPAQLLAEALRRGFVPHDDEHRIVAADAADHGGQIVHRVESRARRAGKARHRFEDHKVLRVVHTQAALAQDALEPVVKVAARRARRGGVTVASAAARLFIQVQLLDVAGNSRLRAGDAAFGKPLEQLLLRFDRVLQRSVQGSSPVACSS